MAQATTIQQRNGRSRRGSRRGSAPRLHAGRLALLALLLIGASFYVSPLREYFAQQDRYQKEAQTLQAARADHATLQREAKLLKSDSHIAEQARSDLMLVPDRTMVFVIKGLPGEETDTVAASTPARTEGSISVLERFEDLWRTLLH